MKWRSLVLLAGIIIAALVVLVGIVNTSLWVMWYLLPAHTTAIALNESFIDDAAREALSALPDTILPADMRAYRGTSTHIAYSRQGDEATLVLAPPLWKLPAQATELRAMGWTVTYQGIVLRASRTTAPLPSLTQATSNALQSILVRSYPFNPFFMARFDSLPPLSESIFAIGTLQGIQTAVELTSAQSATYPTQPKPADTFPSRPDHAVLNIPGQVLQLLPAETAALINQQLATQFGFTKKQPDFITTLKRYEHVLIYMNENQATIAVHSAPDFFDVAHRWLQEEERRYRIEKQAFRLPDGSRGYEFVPGAIRPLLEADSTRKDCFHSVTGAIQATLCSKDGYTLFSTDGADFKGLPLLPEGQYYASLGGKWLTNSGIDFFKTITLRTLAPWTHLELTP